MRQGIWISSFTAARRLWFYHEPIAALSHDRLQRLAVFGLGGAIALTWGVQVWAWPFLCDDAFISFRYAVNLAEHGALEFNRGERVEGYTNFAWVLWLALWHRLGVSPPSVALTTSALCSAGLVALAPVFGRALRGRDGPWNATDLLPAALLTVSPECMVWSSGGLETAAAALATLAATWLLTRRAFVPAAALAGLAYLLRPDTAVPLGGFALGCALVWAWVRALAPPGESRPSIDWRSWGLAALLLVGIVAGHLAWRRVYYDAWWPNTAAIKSAGVLLRDSWGRDYVLAWIDAVHLLHISPLVVLLRLRHLPLVLSIAATLIYGWGVGGDFMAYSRLYLPATVLLAVLLGVLLADVQALLEPRIRHGSAIVVLTALAACLGLGIETHHRWRLDRATPQGWLAKRWEGVTTMDRFVTVGWAVGRWMAAHLPADTLVTVGAAGGVPYGSGLPTLDAFGLVDPTIADLRGAGPHTRGARPGHQFVAPHRYVRSRDPDLLCHVGYRGPRPPSERQAHPAFGRGYRWACIDPGPLTDRRGVVFDPGVYCCRRPAQRAVGPFGATP